MWQLSPRVKRGVQGTAVFSSIDIREGGAQPQDVAKPPVLTSFFADPSCTLRIDHKALQRRTSEALGSQVCNTFGAFVEFRSIVAF